MSLIQAKFTDGEALDVYCSRCGRWCFVEEIGVVADMCKRDVVVVCWGCDHERSDTLPRHVYYLDEVFLLGVGKLSFLAQWATDDLEIRQEDLSLSLISAIAWYNLKSGMVSVLDKQTCGKA